MNLADLFSTTAFRLAILFSALFGVLAAGLFVLIYYVSASFVEGQTAQRLQGELDSLLARYELSGIEGLVDSVQARSTVAGLANLYYLLEDESGNYLAGNLQRWPGDIVVGRSQTRFRRAVQLPAIGVLDWDRDESYEVAAKTEAFPGGQRLLVGIGLYEFSELREQTLGGLLVGSIGSIVLALLVGALMGRAMLSRVQKIDSALGDIMAGDLSRRIDSGERYDEFSRLAMRINGTLERVEQLVSSLRAVTNNVSHDLRTPLHRLRSRLEQVAIGSDRSEQCAQQIESGIRDIDEILVTFGDLLAIAEAEAGTQVVELREVSIGTVVETVAELYAAAAEDRDLSFSWEVAADLNVRGKANLISQALSNLLDNAIKFTPAGGRVAVKLEGGSEGIELSVTDSGPGIPRNRRESVLEPFERLDAARSSPGSGLGLSVVQAIARLHQAHLVLEDALPGLKVTIRFPQRLQ